MTKVIQIMLCAGIVIGCCFGAENFIVSKKKVCSTSALKASCCQTFIETLKLLSEILTSIAKTQEITLESSLSIIENEGRNFTKKPVLEAVLETQSQFNATLRDFKKLFDKHFQHMVLVNKGELSFINPKGIPVAGGVPIV